MKQKIAIVLTGGGARGAYQAGFLRGLSEISKAQTCPFTILTGVSVGSINAAFLACYADDFRDATKRLWTLWATLEPNGVFLPRRGAFLRNGLRWLLRFIFAHSRKKSTSFTPLLSNGPLIDLLSLHLDFDAIGKNLRAGNLHAVAFSATNYTKGNLVTFFDGAESIVPWDRGVRGGQRTTLSVQHVVASAGLPLLFEPVRIGDAYFGDGSIRLTSPLSSAIHLGADKILVVETHKRKEPIKTDAADLKPPSFGAIMATLLRSVFSDALDHDLDTLKTLNRFAASTTSEYRQISTMECSPSFDLNDLAANSRHALPSSFMRFLGAVGAAGHDSTALLSHLAFEKNYTVPLLEAGYKDAIQSRAALEKFLNG